MEEDPFDPIPKLTTRQVRRNRFVVGPFLALLSLGMAAIVEEESGPGWQTLPFSLPLLAAAVIAGRESVHWMHRWTLRRIQQGKVDGTAKDRMRWVGLAAGLGAGGGLPLAKAFRDSELFLTTLALVMAAAAGIMWARLPDWRIEDRLAPLDVETDADRT